MKGWGAPVLAFSGKTNFYRSVYFRSIDRARGTHLRNAGIPFSRFLAAIAGSLNGILGCWFLGSGLVRKLRNHPRVLWWLESSYRQLGEILLACVCCDKRSCICFRRFAKPVLNRPPIIRLLIGAFIVQCNSWVFLSEWELFSFRAPTMFDRLFKRWFQWFKPETFQSHSLYLSCDKGI